MLFEARNKVICPGMLTKIFSCEAKVYFVNTWMNDDNFFYNYVI